MKIVGTSEAGLLLSATEDEVANLIGFYSRYNYGTHPYPKPGDEINISGMFRQLYAMAGIQKELAECAAKLRVCADTITLTAPVIEGAN